MHKFMVNYAAGYVTAACACGGWRQKWVVDGPAFQVLVRLQAEHDRHVWGRVAGRPEPDVVVELSAPSRRWPPEGG